MLKLLSTLSKGREVLQGVRTYYVSTSGSNSNSGLSASNAFLTIQYAYDYMRHNIDTNGYTVTIKLSDGTYAGGLVPTAPLLGGGAVEIRGNSSAPTNVVVQSPVYVESVVGNVFYIYDLTFNLSDVSRAAIDIRGAGISLYFSNVVFAYAATYYHMSSGMGAVLCAGSYSVSYGTSSAHMIASTSGVIRNWGNITITITSSPTFSPFASALMGGIINLNYNATTTISGSVTAGKKYDVQSNSIVTCSSTLPGVSAGTTATGGQYI